MFQATWHINNMVFAAVRAVRDLNNMSLLFLNAVIQLKIQFFCDVTLCCQGILLWVLAPEDKDTMILWNVMSYLPSDSVTSLKTLIPQELCTAVFLLISKYRLELKWQRLFLKNLAIFMNRISAMSNYMESKISLRSNERDVADAGPRICYALMTQ
jgi:hypothetical protein